MSWSKKGTPHDNAGCSILLRSGIAIKSIVLTKRAKHNDCVFQVSESTADF